MPAVRRRPGIASVATLAAITAAVGVAHLAAPEWSRAAGLDVWNAAADRADLRQSLARGTDLDARNAHTLEQIRGSAGIVALVGAGRLSLADAVAELDALNATRACWADGLAASQSEIPTHRRRVARYVIDKLDVQFRDDPSAWAVLAERLEAEYQALPN